MPDQEVPGADAPIVAASAAPTSPPARFRWGIIPATFSWGFGGMGALAVPFAIVAMAIQLPKFAEYEHFAELIGGAIAEFIGLAICSAFWIWAGFRWRCGRWRSAIAFNFAGYGLAMAIHMITKAAGLFTYN